MIGRRSLGMVTLLVVLLLVGRLTKLPDAQLSLLWPAAGAVVWWFLGSRSRVAWVVDSTLLVAVVTVVNRMTGADAVTATELGVANLVHAAVGALVLHLTGVARSGWHRGTGTVHLLIASVAAGAASGALTALLTVGRPGQELLATALLTSVRNTTGTFLVLVLVFGVYRAGRASEVLAGPRRAEWFAVTVLGVVLHVVVFGAPGGLPLAFTLLPLSVWVAVRHGLARTAVFTVGLGLLAVWQTVRGQGAIAEIDSVTQQAAVVQAFLLVTVLTSTLLASMQEERGRMARALDSARAALDEAIDAALIGSGMVVTEGADAGRLVRPNRALRLLLGAQPGPAADGHRPAPVGWLPHLRPQDRTTVRAVLAQIASGERAEWTAELEHHLHDGRTVWAQVHLSVLPLHVSGDDVDGAADPSVGGTGDRRGRTRAAVLQLLDVTARRDAESRLTHMALHDELTGLPNRVLLRERVDLALAQADRSGTHVALVFCDLDHFKSVNDSLGHDAGDAVLSAVAERLRAVLRPTDTVARIGGDEFVACCPGIADPAEADELAARLVAAVSRPVHVDGRDVPVGVSAGLTLSRPGNTAADLLKQSDAAMYEAKRTGRGRVASFADELQVQAGRHLTLTGELRAALDADQFVLHYQPIVDLRTDEAVACEALVRWQHPTRGLLPPGEWLDVAEESDVVVRLGEWVLRTATRDLAGLVRQGRPLTLHVNVSGRQLARPGTVEEVTDALRATRLPAGRLVLELTETHLLEVDDGLLAELGRIRALGVRLAVDDVGTGYSSLTQLVRLPVDSVKVDRGFVADVTTDARAAAVVRGVIGMAEALGLGVVAEGVETDEQAALLRAMGCRTAQGYRWSRPVPLEGLRDLLRGADDVVVPRPRDGRSPQATRPARAADVPSGSRARG